MYQKMNIYEKIEYWSDYLQGLNDLLLHEPDKLEYQEMVKLWSEILRVNIIIDTLKAEIEGSATTERSWYVGNAYDYELL